MLNHKMKKMFICFLKGANTIKTIEGLDKLHSLTTLHLRDNQIGELDGFTEENKMLQYVNIR